MAKGSSSTLVHRLARFVKGLVGLLLIPLVLGLAGAIRGQLDVIPTDGRTFQAWLEMGFLLYVAIHLLVYKPKGLFGLSHQLFGRIMLWLFGGQVASTTTAEKPTARKSAKGAAGSSRGSMLLALSPYLVPLYTILVCVIAWTVDRFGDYAAFDSVVAFLIGASLALHWVMTAEELQQDRARFPIETYLMALVITFLVTLLVVTICLPLAAPGFSFLGTLAEALANARALYTTLIQRLFF